MKNFEYAAPRTETQVVTLLSDQPGHTEILAGGTDLVGLMRKMIVTPERVVNIMEVPSLKVIEPTEEGGLMIGATVTLDEILAHPYLAGYRAVTDAILGINSMQLQAQGTLGGDLCQRPRCWFFRSGGELLAHDGSLDGSDDRYHAIFGNSGPAKFVSSSRIAPALIALGASLRIVGPEEQESYVAVEDFFRTPRHSYQRETILEPNQLLTHVLLPPPETPFSATYEVRHGEGPDQPLAAAAAALHIEGGVVRDARVVMGQVAPVPWVAHEAAAALRGRHVSPAMADTAAAAAVAAATPLSQNQYKVQLAQVAVKRAVLLAAGLQTGGF